MGSKILRKKFKKYNSKNDVYRLLAQPIFAVRNLAFTRLPQYSPYFQKP